VVDGRGELEHDSARIWRYLEKRRGVIDGVVISGGEPTVNPHIQTLIPDIASLGYRIKLDTNGLLPAMIERFAPDYLALDIKTSPERYGRLLGAPYDDVAGRLRRSVAIARAMGERAEVRITVAPGIVDAGAIDTLGDMLRGVTTVYLQPMNRRVPLLDPAVTAREPVTMQEIETFRERLAGKVGRCRIRNPAATSDELGVS
jgi:pyruvate formate lyase activating enzyme